MTEKFIKEAMNYLHICDSVICRDGVTYPYNQAIGKIKKTDIFMVDCLDSMITIACFIDRYNKEHKANMTAFCQGLLIGFRSL